MEDTVLDSNMKSHVDLTISPQIRQFLKETAKWAKFISIIGFVMIGLMIVLAFSMSFFMGSALASIPDAGPLGAMGGGLFGVIYGLMALIYVFPVLYLYRFATKMKMALNSNDQEYLSSSFQNLKSCYKFMGILMIVMLSIYGVMIVIGIGAAAFLG